MGVEITANKANIALIDRAGKVRYRCDARTLTGRSAAATLEPYLRSIRETLDYADRLGLAVSGLGISLPGSLDPSSRRPLSIPILPSLNNVPLCDLLEKQFRLPTHLHVDVDAAVLGEHRFGIGRGFKRLLFVTVNAVLGASLAIDGKVERASQQYIGHVSHMLVANTGPRCSCGKRGCINTLVSTDSMQKMVRRAVERGEETSLVRRMLNREYFSPKLLMEEADRGDSVALNVYGQISRWLSTAVSQYITLFEPNLLILGGSILGTSNLLLSHVRSSVPDASASRVCSPVDIRPSLLGADAALLGAVSPLF